MGGVSIWQLLIIALIVVMLFGTKKLGTIGSDVGAAIKGFKKAMGDEESKSNTGSQAKDADFEAKNLNANQNQSESDLTGKKDKDLA